MNVQLHSRLTLGLIAACGLCALLALAFWLHVGRGYSWLALDAANAPKLPTVDNLEGNTFAMPTFGSFAEIMQRPLFSADRKPIPPDASRVPEKPAPPPVPLQVALTGVIITPDLKMAMLQDNTTNKSVSLREGMPLPGNQSGWTLVEIHPRKVVFADTDEQRQAVELIVAPRSGGARQPQARRADPPKQAASNKTQSAAEKLRARIEQRRQELREKAAQARKKKAASG